MTTVLWVLLGLLADAALSRWVVAQVPQWLPVQASAAAPHVDALFALETGIGTFLFVGCVAVILTTVLLRRAPKYDLVNGDPIEGNLTLEITWTLLPLVIVALLTWQAIRVNATLATLGGKQRVTDGAEAMVVSAAATTGEGAGLPYGPVQVIARQWSWEFVYPEGVRSSELHLPLNRPARFELISLDVLHGFYIPAFRLKQDIVPGSVIAYRLTPTRIGRYRLRDSMFSGGYFASNQSLVVVQSEADYQSWLKQAAAAPLRPSWNEASELYQRRLARGDHGWAVVPPAAPPLVNVGLDAASPHDA